MRCVQFRVCSQPARRVVAKCRCIAVALGDHHCQLTVRRSLLVIVTIVRDIQGRSKTVSC